MLGRTFQIVIPILSESPIEVSCPLLAWTHFAILSIINSTAVAKNAILDPWVHKIPNLMSTTWSLFCFCSCCWSTFSDSTKPYLRTGIGGRTLIKTLTLAPYCKSVLYFSPEETFRKDALRNGKAPLSFSLPFCMDETPHGVFPCSLWFASHTKDWATGNCFLIPTILTHFSLLTKVSDTGRQLSSLIFIEWNVGHDSYHVYLLQKILATGESSWGWKARKSTRSWQDPKR